MSKRTTFRNGSARKARKQSRWTRLRSLCQLAMTNRDHQSAPHEQRSGRHHGYRGEPVAPARESEEGRGGAEREQRDRGAQAEGQHGGRSGERAARIDGLEQGGIDQAAGEEAEGEAERKFSFGREQATAD